MNRPAREAVERAVRAALAEDLGPHGDVTTDAIVDPGAVARGRFVARSQLVVAGLDVAREVFRQLDERVLLAPARADGERVEPGTTLAAIGGPARAVLYGERTALNFLMRMSGIATAASAAVAEVAGMPARILDTRKTAPGLRALDKYAVTAGGAHNHRMGLWDGVMIKDTHLGTGIGITEAVRRVLERGHPPGHITVEVRDLGQLDEAIAAGAGRLLLDNMEPARLREAVLRAAGRAVTEASGGLRPGGLREVAETGVDWLSVGWLTHSAPAADVALELEAGR